MEEVCQQCMTANKIENEELRMKNEDFFSPRAFAEVKDMADGGSDEDHAEPGNEGEVVEGGEIGRREAEQNHHK